MINGRKIAMKAFVGSHNYNLDTPESDKDYKYFVLPTFGDLYDGKQCSENYVSGKTFTIPELKKDCLDTLEELADDVGSIARQTKRSS